VVQSIKYCSSAARSALWFSEPIEFLRVRASTKPFQVQMLRVNQDGKRDNQDGKFLKGLFSEVLAPI
jgi:hypothetical protein